jgi:hypothetical protein
MAHESDRLQMKGEPPKRFNSLRPPSPGLLRTTLALTVDLGNT